MILCCKNRCDCRCDAIVVFFYVLHFQRLSVQFLHGGTMPVTQEVAGSSPVGPAITKKGKS